MSKKQDKGGILGLGVLSSNRPKILEKVKTKEWKPEARDKEFEKQEFCRLSSAMIEDERKASSTDYNALADALYRLKDLIPPEQLPQLLHDHQLLIGIRQQEAAHLQLNEAIKRRWC